MFDNIFLGAKIRQSNGGIHMAELMDGIAKQIEKKAREDSMVILLRAGWTLQQVADEYKVTRQYIGLIAKKNGLKRENIGAAVKKAKAAKE
ncbi:MAG: hypothetical protein R8K20_11250 [Gallionellaceae bacterium]